MNLTHNRLRFEKVINAQSDSRSGLLVANEGRHLLGLADAPGKADMAGAIDKEVVDNHLKMSR